jgi:diguanylate cyclase (GGDEF)-like protein
MMQSAAQEYKVSKYLTEFQNRRTEEAYQKHIQKIVTRQLRITLVSWAIILLSFAIPDYLALGVSGSFFYLLAYRVIIALSLLLVIANIKPDTDFFKISRAVALVAVAGFTGFMLFFLLRPDITIWVIGMIMIQIVFLMIFIPIRFILAAVVGIYAVVITMATRLALGTTTNDLIGLFFLLTLPYVLGGATTMRLGISQRRQYSLFIQTETINQELMMEIEHRRALELKLKEMASTDPLTGLANRREYETLFMHEIHRARRSGTPLAACILDLDHFKRVNDTYGHAAGDAVLRNTAQLLKQKLRTMDIIGRLGGEEFIILLPETTIDQAAAIGTRLLEALAEMEIDVGKTVIRVTATIGISGLIDEDETFNSIIARADEALYRGKNAGRNRVEIKTS